MRGFADVAHTYQRGSIIGDVRVSGGESPCVKDSSSLVIPFPCSHRSSFDSRRRTGKWHEAVCVRVVFQFEHFVGRLDPNHFVGRKLEHFSCA